MTLDYYVVDAFCERPFGGNPAGVCPLAGWLDDDLMLSIAAELRFHAPMRGYDLVCRRAGDMIEMDFPRIPPAPIACDEDFVAALGAAPSEVLATERDLVLVYDDEAVVRGMKPDFDRIAGFSHCLSAYVTAPATEYDYVARAFWPKLGIPEDPVCGSMQSALVPFWSERLGRRELVCEEPSERGGVVWCHDRGDTVRIAGHGRLYLRGQIEV